MIEKFSPGRKGPRAPGVMIEAVREIAERKNVRLDANGCQVFADAVLSTFRPRDIRRLLAMRDDALALAARTINRKLDVLAIARFSYLKARMEGEENPDIGFMLAIGEAAVAQFAANLPDLLWYRWPDPADELRATFASVDAARVAIRLPEGTGARASYTLTSMPEVEAAAEPLTFVRSDLVVLIHDATREPVPQESHDE